MCVSRVLKFVPSVEICNWNTLDELPFMYAYLNETVPHVFNSGVVICAFDLSSFMVKP